MYLDRLEIRHDVLRGFDPRARLAGAFLLILTVVSLKDEAALVCIAAICMVLLIRDFTVVLKRLAPLEFFCILFLFQAVFGLLETHAALIYILRVNCAALLYMLAAVPPGIGGMARTLNAIKVSPKLVAILFLSYRYSYLMLDKVAYSIRAMNLRRSPHRKGTFSGWKFYAAVFAAALTGAFIKAEGVGAALVKRGFDGVIPQTGLWKWKTRDTFFIILCGGSALFYVIWNI